MGIDILLDGIFGFLDDELDENKEYFDDAINILKNCKNNIKNEKNKKEFIEMLINAFDEIVYNADDFVSQMDLSNEFVESIPSCAIMIAMALYNYKNRVYKDENSKYLGSFDFINERDEYITKASKRASIMLNVLNVNVASDEEILFASAVSEAVSEYEDGLNIPSVESFTMVVCNHFKHYKIKSKILEKTYKKSANL